MRIFISSLAVTHSVTPLAALSTCEVEFLPAKVYFRIHEILGKKYILFYMHIFSYLPFPYLTYFTQKMFLENTFFYP